jgi:hypothetical protein
MLTARAATRATVRSEIMAFVIIKSFAAGRQS